MNGKLPQQQAMADAIRAREVAQTGAPSQYMGMGGMDAGNPGLGGGMPPGDPGLQQAGVQGARQGLGMNTMGVNPSQLTHPGNPNMPV